MININKIKQSGANIECVNILLFNHDDIRMRKMNFNQDKGKVQK